MTWISSLREAPRKAAHQRDLLERAARERADHARTNLHEAMGRATQLRDQGRLSIWKLETRALRRVGRWLDRAPTTPVVARVRAPLGRIVSRRLDAVTQPVAGFATMNVRDALSAVRSFEDPVVLHALLAAERAHKARATVIKAIEARLAR